MSLIDQLMSRMALPVLGAPMFIVSTPALVIAQCTSGVIAGFRALIKDIWGAGQGVGISATFRRSACWSTGCLKSTRQCVVS